MKDYTYTNVRVSRETAEMCEKAMKLLGIKRLNVFASVALVDYANRTMSALNNDCEKAMLLREKTAMVEECR